MSRVDCNALWEKEKQQQKEESRIKKRHRNFWDHFHSKQYWHTCCWIIWLIAALLLRSECFVVRARSSIHLSIYVTIFVAGSEDYLRELWPPFPPHVQETDCTENRISTTLNRQRENIQFCYFQTIKRIVNSEEHETWPSKSLRSVFFSPPMSMSTIYLNLWCSGGFNNMRPGICSLLVCLSVVFIITLSIRWFSSISLQSPNTYK